MSDRRTGDLAVDWPACTARGVCHELLPEVIDLDPWGYPLITGQIDAATWKRAREAVSACPRQALRLSPR
jgi:ferredoxin